MPAICIFQPCGRDAAASTPLDSSDVGCGFLCVRIRPNSVRALRMQFGEAASFPRPSGLIAPTLAAALNPQIPPQVWHKTEDRKQPPKRPRPKRLNRHGTRENLRNVGMPAGAETGLTAASWPKSAIAGAMAMRGTLDHEFWPRCMANLLQAGRIVPERGLVGDYSIS